MANICITHVYAGGDEADVAQLRALYPFDFAALVPMPADLMAVARAKEDQLHAAGIRLTGLVEFEWRIDNWGCNGLWEMTLLVDEPRRLAVCMETPWSPPYGVLHVLSERFGELEFGVVAHDTDGPGAHAWRSVAGVPLDLEQWELTVTDYSEDWEMFWACDEWASARIRALEERLAT